MAHRFPIGTTYTPLGRKHATLHTVFEQFTTTNSKGVIVHEYYSAVTTFAGQTIVVGDVGDTTIARGLAPEDQHLLRSAG